MLNRRHIRLKVMQSLYSYNLSKDNDFLKAEKAMMKSFDDVIELKFCVVSLFILLVKYAEEYYQKGKSKYLPSKEDLNPNLRFVKNQFVLSILNNIQLIDHIKKNLSFWTDNDHDVINKLFIELYKSDLYKIIVEEYVKEENVVEADRAKIDALLRQIRGEEPEVGRTFMMVCVLFPALRDSSRVVRRSER